MAEIFKRYIGGQNTQQDPTPASPPASQAHAPSSSPAPAVASTPRPATGGPRNVLSSDVEIKGTVKFSNDLVVDGKIEGQIASDGNLTVGENARIKAEIKTSTVVVYGKVHGNITAADRVDLKATAEVVGDIKAKVLSIDAGATFVGKSTVGASAQAAASGAAAAPAKTAAPKEDLLAGTTAKG